MKKYIKKTSILFSVMLIILIGIVSIICVLSKAEKIGNNKTKLETPYIQNDLNNALGNPLEGITENQKEKKREEGEGDGNGLRYETDEGAFDDVGYESELGFKNIGNDSPDRLKFVDDGVSVYGQIISLSYGDKIFKLDIQKYSSSKRVSALPETENIELLRLIAKEQGFGHREALRYVFDGLVEDTEKWLSAFVDRTPKNAELKFLPDSNPKFHLSEHAFGRVCDRKTLYSDIFLAITKGKSAKITVLAKRTNPSVFNEDLTKQTYLRSFFETSVASSGEERKSNIALSLKAWNGLKIDAGETVGFNAIVGARTEQRGYKTAKIILKGKFEDGVGGGVCQSSTTIYNAALMADMFINSAKNHSLSVGYVEPSFDAMVNISSSDLEFTNRGDYPVYVRAFSDGVRARVEFYGTRLPYTIKRKSVIVKKIPPPADEIIVDYKKEYTNVARYTDESAYHVYPKEGLESKGYLQYYNSKGKLIKERLIRKDKYQYQRGVLVQGTEIRPATIFEQTEF